MATRNPAVLLAAVGSEGGTVPLVTLSLVLAIHGASEENVAVEEARRLRAARMLVDYFEQMCEPQPFVVRRGEAFRVHRRETRERLLRCTGLAPLPERVPLDVHMTPPLTHPWCTIRRAYYQLWPDVYTSGLLYMPKDLPVRPAPAVLCPHGHWKDGNAHPDVQRRCLTFAKAGYVVFSTTQYHFEDLGVGTSHQTIMIWNNMRALDLLEGIEEVDGDRIGVCGASGGGLQTQMLTALDPRVKAAVIVGMTCDFREILFPHQRHCECNHYPNVMQFTDAPEISALACPTPVLYLTMNDWTEHFRLDNFPTVQALYDANGAAADTECVYEPTEHVYDLSKREMTYAWMDAWVRADATGAPTLEPETVETVPPATLWELTLDSPREGDFALIRDHVLAKDGARFPVLKRRRKVKAYCGELREELSALLGVQHVLPRVSEVAEHLSTETEGHFVVERVTYPSEGPVRIPTIILRRQDRHTKRPVIVICGEAGSQALLEERGEGSAFTLAAAGALVVLPDVRFVGGLSCIGLAGEMGPELMRFAAAHPLGKAADEPNQASDLRQAWERNALVWGRPLPGMACTDMQAVLDGLGSRDDADMTDVTVIARGSGHTAVAALFAAALDSRVRSVDADFQGGCFENGQLPMVPFVLLHGDVLEWAVLVADRQVTLRNVPEEAGDREWLRKAFDVMDNSSGLEFIDGD